MTVTLSPDQVLRARLAAQWLGGERIGVRSVGDVARHMLAVQGQDWPSSRWALGVRAPGVTLDDVTTAFNRAEIVRSWPMRGTVHVLPAEDLGWLQRLLEAKPVAGAPKRRAYLGITDETLDRLVDVSIAALAEGPQDRETLSTAWTEAGIEWKSNWRYHLIWWLAQIGLAVFGPIGDRGEPLLVATKEWIAAPRELTGDDALAELARRYAEPRGPVTAKDLAWWAGIGVREARRGLELATETGALTTAKAAEGDVWVDPALLDAPAPPEWLLLPAFDEHLLGYTDRSAQLDPEHSDRIVPGRNGVFAATVAHRGRVVGTWKRGAGAADGPELTAMPGISIDAAALSPEIDRWQAFLGR